MAIFTQAVYYFRSKKNVKGSQKNPLNHWFVKLIVFDC